MDPARRRRKQRHRMQLMSGFAVITVAALLLIAHLVMVMNRLPGAVRLSASTSNSAHTISDGSTGLTLRLLSSPWRNGCPMRDYPVNWTTGEGAKAGQALAGAGRGHSVDWYANACVGLLPGNMQSGNLSKEAANAANAIDTDKAISHKRTVTGSGAIRVNGHRAWKVTFDVHYPGQHLAWSSEAGAMVVVDRGAGQAPAVFYVSAPSNLGGAATVSTLISSLR
jgi:hypothetical protein